MNRDIDDALAAWVMVTTDDRHTDKHYATAWRSLPAMAIELIALRGEQDRHAQLTQRYAQLMGQFDRITWGVADLIETLKDTTGVKISRIWVLQQLEAIYNEASQ